MKVIIPAKESSSRCANKNFRVFHKNRSLIEIKIKQVLKIVKPADIILIGDGKQGFAMAARCGYGWLDDSHVVAEGFQNAVRYWFECIHDEEIMQTFCTNPLFNQYEQVVKDWNDVKEKHDSLMVTIPFQHYVVDKEGTPINFQYGYWHKESQKLPDWYFFDWAATIIKGDVAKETKYPIGRNPYVWSYAGKMIDIDTEEDFKMAQWYYQKTVNDASS